MSPAGTTVERNVLIPDVCQIVGAIDVIPQPLVGEIDTLERSLNNRGSGLIRLFVTGLIFSHIVF